VLGDTAGQMLAGGTLARAFDCGQDGVETRLLRPLGKASAPLSAPVSDTEDGRSVRGPAGPAVIARARRRPQALGCSSAFSRALWELHGRRRTASRARLPGIT
jgi:hypothetical protein